MNKDKTEKIQEYLNKITWPHILDKILTKEDMNERGDLNSASCLELEDIFKGMGATFGLAAYPDYDEED